MLTHNHSSIHSFVRRSNKNGLLFSSWDVLHVLKLSVILSASGYYSYFAWVKFGFQENFFYDTVGKLMDKSRVVK